MFYDVQSQNNCNWHTYCWFWVWFKLS